MNDPNKIEKKNNGKQNFIISMCVRPRETIEQILETNNKKYIILLFAAITGFVKVLTNISILTAVPNTTTEFPYFSKAYLLLFALICGSIIGIAVLYIFSGIIFILGRLQGGVASAKNLRVVMAYSSIPIIISAYFVIKNFLYFYTEISIDILIFSGMGGISGVIAGTWSFVIYIECLAQVQHFSLGKAFISTIIAALLSLVPLIMINYIAMYKIVMQE